MLLPLREREKVLPTCPYPQVVRNVRTQAINAAFDVLAISSPVAFTLALPHRLEATDQKGRELNAPHFEAPRTPSAFGASRALAGRVLGRSCGENSRSPKQTVPEATRNLVRCLFLAFLRYSSSPRPPLRSQLSHCKIFPAVKHARFVNAVSAGCKSSVEILRGGAYKWQRIDETD